MFASSYTPFSIPFAGEAVGATAAPARATIDVRTIRRLDTGRSSWALDDAAHVSVGLGMHGECLRTSNRRWLLVVAALAALRTAVPLAALAASGEQLPGLPRYRFVALPGDATGYYAATREFMAAWGRLPSVAVAVLALATAA